MPFHWEDANGDIVTEGPELVVFTASGAAWIPDLVTGAWDVAFTDVYYEEEDCVGQPLVKVVGAMTPLVVGNLPDVYMAPPTVDGSGGFAQSRETFSGECLNSLSTGTIVPLSELILAGEVPDPPAGMLHRVPGPA